MFRSTLEEMLTILHLISRLVLQVFRGHVLTLLWAAAVGMKVNAKKSLAFGAVKLYVGEVKLTVVPKCKIMGHLLHRGAQLAETPTNRVKEVQRRLQRVALLPCTKQQKIPMIAATVMPVMYGFETAQLVCETLRELRCDVWQAVRAGRSVSRVEAIEALLTIYCSGSSDRSSAVSGISYGEVLDSMASTTSS